MIHLNFTSQRNRVFRLKLSTWIHPRANGSRSYSLSVIKSRFDGSFLDVATAGSTRTARASALCTPDIAEGSAKGSFSRLDFLSNEMPSVAKSHIKNLPLGGICLIIAMAFKKEQSLQPNGECGIRMSKESSVTHHMFHY